MKCWLLGVCCALVSQVVFAQEARDEEARTAHQTAVTAYEDGDMELAMSLFERAYELSPRPQLLYNIGSTAERLGRTERAIEAYAAFLEALPEHDKADFVRGRLADMRSRTEAAAQPSEHEGQPSEHEGPRLGLALGLPLALVGVGVMGVGIVGLATADGCVDENAMGVCVEETTANTGAIAGYLAVGGAALIAGLTWLIVDALGDDDDVQVGLGPTSVSVRGRF